MIDLSQDQLPTVIIPVFNAVTELNNCLESVFSNLPETAEVLVIDDASSEHEVRELLEHWQARTNHRWQFVFEPQNKGFVATVNQGMRMTHSDVVLLNSDTEVTPGWLEGLARCLCSNDRIATATPWTNNGEIASLPDFCRVNPRPFDVNRVASVIATTASPRYPELPTAVGFCMAISRAAIDTLGFFDEETFGKGYGEENDFSMRAQQAGMKNVLCDDVYVMHVGGRSFEPLGLKPDDSTMERLLSLHPGSLKQVQAFIDADPLAALRSQLLEALHQANCVLN